MCKPVLVSEKQLEAALLAWGGGEIIRPLQGGHRNLAFLVRIARQLRVAKTTRRSEAALRWLLPVFDIAETARVGLAVPRLITSQRGNVREQGWTLETFFEGEPAQPQHLAEMARLMGHFHEVTANLPQRPGFGSSQQLLHQFKGGDVDLKMMPKALVDVCRHHWHAFADTPQAVIHGDINPSNVVVTAEGTLALIDWDEARYDLTCFDEFAIRQQQGGNLSAAEAAALAAWEVAVSWQLERDYAETVAARLLQGSDKVH